jgi:hypothetical protein
MDDLTEVQERLGRTLDRARAGDHRRLAAGVREHGERLVRLLNGALGMARLHAADNHAFDQPVADLSATLAQLVPLLGVVHVLAVEDQVYVNDVRIRLDGADAGHELGGKLRKHAVGGLSFHASLSGPQIRMLVTEMAAPADPDRPRAARQEALIAKGLDVVELTAIHRLPSPSEKEPAPRDGGTLSARVTARLDETWDNLGANRLPNPLPLRRVVTEMLAAGANDAELWDEAADSSPYAAHTLRVCRLALVLGRALGLPDGLLQDLGVAAAFHDVGYAAREGGSGASPGDAPPFERHPVAGARLLLRQRGFHEAKVRRALAALHHHRRYDDVRGRPSLFGRILAIAEDYDNWVRPRGGGLTPEQALARMAAESGGAYDPVLLQLFINALGSRPPGTPITLADGREARVVSTVRSPETFDRPMVRIERRADGTAPAEATFVDLAVETAAVPVPIASIPDPDVDSIVLLPPASPPLPAPPPPPATGIDVVPPPELGGSRRELYEGVLPEVLREIYVSKKTGVLHLSRGGERRSLRFWKGHIVYAQSNVADEHMGEVALREGLVSPEGLANASACAVREDLRLGAALCSVGLMNETQVEELIVLHVRHVLEKAIPCNDASYDFERRPADASWFEEMTMRISTADVILDAVRRIQAPDIVRFHLGDIDRVLVSSRDPLQETAPCKLSPMDGFVLSRVDGELTARQVIRIVPHDPQDVQRSLFGLLCIGLVRYAGKAR